MMKKPEPKKKLEEEEGENNHLDNLLAKNFER